MTAACQSCQSQMHNALISMATLLLAVTILLLKRELVHLTLKRF